MSKAIISAGVILLSFLQATAYNITGSVFNATENGPEPYATLRIYSIADSAIVIKAATSDATGAFKITIANNGSYRMIVSAIGSIPATKLFDIKGKNVNLGTITLKTDTTSLEEITVTAIKPIVKREIDRLSYDVQADDDAETSTILDILRKVPMVSVDGQNNITVKGNSSFKVYKNGRPNKAFTSNAKDILNSIPASSIKRIEVITDPGAREDAEGVGVILNIVTNDETELSGITGTASLFYNTLFDFPSPRVYLTGQIDKVMLSGWGGVNHQTKNGSLFDNESEATFIQTGDTRQSRSSHWATGWSEYFGIESSWEPDTLNLATLELNAWNNNSSSTSHATYTTLNGGEPIQRYTQDSFTPHSGYFDISGTANYQRSTRRKGETITLSYQLSYNKQNSRSNTTYSDLVNFDEPYSAIKTDSKQSQQEHTVQLDWSRPYGEHHTLDIGGKYIFREAKSKSQQEYVDAFSACDDFRHRTQVGAIYADYRINFARWSARAGVRYEYSELAARFFHSDKEPFSSRLHDVVPNVAASWRINDANNLKLSFGTSISRPGIWYLNPAVNITPSSVSSGNPDLKSSRNNSLNLEYSLTSKKIYLEISAGYSFSNDIIAPTQRVDENNVIYNSYGNVTSLDLFNFSIYAQWTPTPKTSVMANINGAYGMGSYPKENISLNRFVFWPYLRFTQEIPWKLKLTLSGGWSSGSMHSVYAYGTAGDPWYEIGLQRSFLKDDRLSVRISTANPFGPYTKKYDRIHYVNTGYTGYAQSSDPRAAYVWANVSFRFGNLKSSVKKVNKSISNDDLKGGGGGQSTGK